jgi:hypothetical protein
LFVEAEQDEICCTTMKEEIKSIQENRTWELIKLSRSHRAIGQPCEIKVKKDEIDIVIKHKSRLVAKGYVQQTDINFD